jgi:hypothetical protein
MNAMPHADTEVSAVDVRGNLVESRISDNRAVGSSRTRSIAERAKAAADLPPQPILPRSLGLWRRLREPATPSVGDIDIAYQVLGDGRDLLVLPDRLISIDSIDSRPSLYRFHRRLAAFARVIRFDQRGTGLSSRISTEGTIGPITGRRTPSR